ncbi:MAG TPA: peptide-methionine (S)-S-oxide reductase MsrA [Bryobacteraceae bacterium]
MPKLETATLGGGCFWCLEAVYERMEGVLSAVSGYMGGHTENPSYRDVCSGATGHVEVVQVTFDTEATSYREILDVFFSIHDPTTRDRQGNDVGTQYRSVIYTHSGQQRDTAVETIRELQAAGAWPSPIVTEVRPASTFYRAEDYHQGYFRGNSQQPYCAYVVAPKVRKFAEKFAGKVKGGKP